MKQSKTMKEMFKLPFKEEVANAISHGVMAFIILCLIPYYSIYTYTHASIHKTIGVAIYLICMFLMFLISTIYHSMEFGSNQKYVFRKLDHICIYLAIAGSYTPIVLTLLPNTKGYIILGIEWIAVIVGVLLKSISKYTHPKLSMILYMAMGWAAVLILPTLIKVCQSIFLTLIILGGICYSLGAFFYSHPEKPFFHFIWHLWINLASILHFIAIIYFM